MSQASRTRSPRLPILLATTVFVAMSAAAAMAPEPIVGPPIAIGETGVAVADPIAPNTDKET